MLWPGSAEVRVLHWAMDLLRLEQQINQMFPFYVNSVEGAAQVPDDPPGSKLSKY